MTTYVQLELPLGLEPSHTTRELVLDAILYITCALALAWDRLLVPLARLVCDEIAAAIAPAPPPAPQVVHFMPHGTRPAAPEQLRPLSSLKRSELQQLAGTRRNLSKATLIKMLTS